ncbi:acetyl CoA carboxylase (alpha and beta subunits) [Streptomyces lincolnensis]|uniref:Acetyl-coenzyme A carboxylase carboxyl transferase subunits beta/alpha n=1 Tax=Streptomyces lincolnensis TaxID=1915 RepID=A0A1B1M8R4_STRLN|nr:carboxyl transferase domain-containing protein [Streptomyces lincolnensis]ANS65021.1 acetyl CoA carboxylase (alpha and beta subunits) [Streptomyces lincolnensis]AXG56771.1 acetyl CoA carboxylase (alpha and beta subunits) [Streptomyces lincolnensis]QMV06812.1 acetyl-CoA carboxylase carboxyl transferase subunit alpha/beta [Streptomyces lincolnensis]
MTERPTAREVLALIADDFTELPYPAKDSAPDGPLAWQGYDASRARAAERTGETESVVCGTAHVEGTRAVLIAFEFGFLGGSLGERTGDRLEAAYTHAREHRLPVVPLVATGGSRMQEGMLALTQLQRVARQSALTREAGLPQISVLRDPTTGGGWATLGAGADVILALPGAQVGFAGSRVRPPDADPAAYTAEAQLAAGAVDAVVPPADLRGTLGRWLRLLTGGTGAAPEPGEPGATEAPTRATTGPGGGRSAARAPGGPGTAAAPAPPAGEESAGEPARSPRDATGQGPVAPVPTAARPAPVPAPLGASALPATGWDAVQRARSPRRPRAEAYLDAYFADRLAISGDRCGGTDPGGMLCGFGEREGRTIAYAAQTGTPTRPAGYRTAARLIRLAGRLGIPVLTLVDTPGAANDAEAERQGAGAAIADVFGAVATARTPVTTLVIGEGGSGGALALAAPGNTWATPDSYFSVIAPELAAAILKRPPEEVEATADQLRIRPQDLMELEVIRKGDQPFPGTGDRRS